jgi:hypothetical protein
VESCHFNTVGEVNNLAILCRYVVDSLDDISQEYIQTQFYRVLNTQLIEKGNYERSDSSFHLIYGSLKDDNLKSQIAFGYHYELSRLAILHPRDSSTELYHMQAAYDINPGNENLRGFIVASCFRFVEKASSPQNIIELIGRYSTRFGFLDSNEYITGVKANCLLEMSYRSFCLNKTTEADSLLKEFEKLYARQTKMTLNQKYVEKTYMTAAGIYFRKGNYTRSRQYIQSGLTYAPGSFGLNQMLRQH